MLAYILISVKDGAEAEMYRKLQDFNEIKDINILFGEWDIIAKIESENTDALATFVIDKIRSESYVKLTSTLIVANIS